MNKLTLAAGMIALGLSGFQAQAGSPMMDDPLPISVRGDTGTDSYKAETGTQTSSPGGIKTNQESFKATDDNYTLAPKRKQGHRKKD